MANTYTQIHIHAIFAVQFRFGLIQNDWKDELYKYITGIVQKQNHKMLCINGMPDHVHIFFGMRPVQSLSDLLQDIKSGSAGWINKCKLVRGRFQWQEGYGAFSYSKSQANDVINYIRNQEAHHRHKRFLDEYQELLEEFGVEYDGRYLFKEPQ